MAVSEEEGRAAEQAHVAAAAAVQAQVPSVATAVVQGPILQTKALIALAISASDTTLTKLAATWGKNGGSLGVPSGAGGDGGCTGAPNPMLNCRNGSKLYP
eukprot:2399015-Prymnesium_polylepis.1